MGAIGAEREAEAGMMIGDILDVTVMVKMAIDHREATSIEVHLVVDHAPSRQVTTDTTAQVQMDDLGVRIQSEMMTELEIGVIDQ
jgi:hypothetical protein